MPFSYRIEKDRDLVVVNAEGLLTPKFIEECVAAYFSDSDFHPAMDVLFEIDDDITIEIEGSDKGAITLATSGVLEDIEERVSRVREGYSYRRAAVGGLTKDKTLFMAAMGLADMNSECRAFSDRSAALEWLKDGK